MARLPVLLVSGLVAAAGSVVAAVDAGHVTRVAAAADGPAVDCLAKVPGSTVDITTATIPQLRAALDRGDLTSRQLVQAYLDRIDAWDQQGPKTNAIRALAKDALAQADRADAAHRRGENGGPLAGIPILLKDNMDTADMPTTAGSVALAGPPPPKDSFLAARLRAAGAIILGKTNLTEFANFMSTRMPNGYSSLGGQVKNPYNFGDPLGSSSGSGVAAAMTYAAGTFGSETQGSIIAPSDVNSAVGVKPTTGLISRSGIIPISASQDTGGPIARSVTDVAALLGPVTGVDPEDAATAPSQGKAKTDYLPFLKADSLKGARFGYSKGDEQLLNDQQKAVIEKAKADLTKAGATIIDIPYAYIASAANQSTVLYYEFRRDLNAYLKRRGPTAPQKMLADIIAFNKAHADVALKYGQDILEKSEAESNDQNAPRYMADRERDKNSAQASIDGALTAFDLDAIIVGSYFGVGAGAQAGYPTVIVPAGYADRTPIGLSFMGTAWSEPQLLSFAYAYEQLTKHRQQPTIRNVAKFPCPPPKARGGDQGGTTGGAAGGGDNRSGTGGATPTTPARGVVALRIAFSRFGGKASNPRYRAKSFPLRMRVVKPKGIALKGVRVTLTKLGARRPAAVGTLARLRGSGTVTLRRRARLTAGRYGIVVTARTADGRRAAASARITLR